MELWMHGYWICIKICFADENLPTKKCLTKIRRTKISHDKGLSELLFSKFVHDFVLNSFARGFVGENWKNRRFLVVLGNYTYIFFISIC